MTDRSLLYPASVAEAKAIQEKLRHAVILQDEFKTPIRLVAGIDVGYDRKQNLSRAIVALMIDNVLVTSVMAVQETPFPYIPGLLSFREAPAILEALAKLPETPDLLMVDGQGIAHPRRLGIASHIGVMAGIPAIGVAKKRLTGTYREPDMMKGSRSVLKDKGELLGTVLRSKSNVRPLFISPGHKVSHESACRIVEMHLAGYRLPEPTRLADRLSKIKL